MSGRFTSALPMARPKARRVIGLAIAAAVLGVALIATPTAQAARSEFYGIAQGSTLDGRDLTGMANARVRTNRFMLNWELVQPTNKRLFNWGPTDRFVGALAAHGIRPVPWAWGSPPWVADNPATPPIDTAARREAWRRFLNAAVARYGRGGSYWTGGYHRDYGAGATPRPVQAWQIWNEPSLTKFFRAARAPAKYARLVRISHDPIKGRDPQAQIVLAGMTGDSWGFLDDFYSVSGIKPEFDVVALHPYGSDLATVRLRIRKARDVMRTHEDQTTPLWITELAWGSAPPDSYGINQGPWGQATMLRRSFRLILERRTPWKVQRLFWYHWRDPRDPVATCSFCGSAGLLRYDRMAKPALSAFKSFASERIPPEAAITSGPGEGSFIRNPMPMFSFASSEAGSTFECRVDAGPLDPCGSPYTLPHLTNGPHQFSVRAIDAPGNVSPFESRSFTVDTFPPAIPRITATNPPSPANENHPRVIGTAGAGTTVTIYRTAGCTGSPAARGMAGEFKSSGIAVSVADNSTTTFRARATDEAGNTSGCSAGLTYIEDSTP